MADALDNLKQLELRLKLIGAKLDGFSQTISQFRIFGELMSAEMDRLVTEVSEIKTVIDSAVATLEGVADQVRDAAGDRVKSVALADELDAKATRLAGAIANVPTASTPPTP